MSLWAWLVATIFLLWLLTYIYRSYRFYQAGILFKTRIRYIWLMNFGVGFGFLIYNYEIERLLALAMHDLPFSPSTLRAINGHLLIVFTYWWSVHRTSRIRVPRWIFPFILFALALTIAVDVFLYHRIAYAQLQLILTLFILVPAIFMAIVLMPITRTIIRSEKQAINRAHYYFFIIELGAAFLGACIYVFDAIHKLWIQDYAIYSFAVILGQVSLLFFLLPSNIRLLDDRWVRWILYPAKIRTYWHLRQVSDRLHRLAQVPYVYNYPETWVPTFDRIELETYRMFITIFDVARFLADIDPPIYAYVEALREQSLTYDDTLKRLLQIPC